MHQAQGLGGLPTTVDQVTAKPQAITRRIKANFLQQTLGHVVATLQVANCPDGHQLTVSVQSARNGQGERRDGRGKAGAIIGQHVVTATHGADIGFQYRA